MNGVPMLQVAPKTGAMTPVGTSLVEHVAFVHRLTNGWIGVLPFASFPSWIPAAILPVASLDPVLEPSLKNHPYTCARPRMLLPVRGLAGQSSTTASSTVTLSLTPVSDPTAPNVPRS